MYYYYELGDDNDNYGIIGIKDVKIRKFEKLIADYIKTDEEEYNNDGFCQYLEDKSYNYKFIDPQWVHF